MDRFFATVKKEKADRFPTYSDAKMALFDYIQVFYNQRRRHSTLGQVSPDYVLFVVKAVQNRPPPIFIEVLVGAAVGQGIRQVAGAGEDGASATFRRFAGPLRLVRARPIHSSVD